MLEKQTRIPCVAILNFGWFLERGSDVVQGGSYISHLLPIHKSVQTVRGFLANQGGGGSIDIVSPVLLHLPIHTLLGQDICRHFLLARAPLPQADLSNL